MENCWRRMNYEQKCKKAYIIRNVFVNDVRNIIDSARQTAVRSIFFCRVQIL